MIQAFSKLTLAALFLSTLYLGGGWTVNTVRHQIEIEVSKQFVRGIPRF